MRWTEQSASLPLQTLAALAERAPDLDALLPVVYDDVPVALHPVARRSLLAHLIKLRHEGRAAADGEHWHWRG